MAPVDLASVMVRCLVAPGSASRLLEQVAAEGRLSELCVLAARHGVLGGVCAALATVPTASVELGPWVPDRLRAGALRHVRALADLRALADVFGPAGVTWLAVKGPVLAELAYAQPELRTYEDLDVVVAADQFADAIEALEAAGCPVIDTHWSRIRRQRRGQLHATLRFGTIADVHWHLLNHAAVRSGFDVPMRQLFDRARRVTVGGVELLTLDVHDTLVHTCLHAAVSGAHKVKWLWDVRQLIAAGPIHWDTVVAISERWHASPSVGVVLRRSERVCGAAVPQEVLDELLPERWRRRITAAVESRRPVERATSELSLASVWAQAQRTGAAATFTTLLTRPSRHARSLAADRAARLWPRPPAAPGVANVARAKYLETVASGSSGRPSSR